MADKQNVLLTGFTGVGKSFLACALGQKACRDGYSVVYRRASRLFDELAQARADGTHPHALKRLAKAQVLILDDSGLEPLGEAERKELLEVVEDRYQQSSTVVTSQLTRRRTGCLRRAAETRLTVKTRSGTSPRRTWSAVPPFLLRAYGPGGACSS